LHHWRGLPGSDFRSTRQREFSELNATKTKHLLIPLVLIFGFAAFFATGGSCRPTPGWWLSGNGVLTASNVICIGTSGADVNDSCYVGNIWTQPGGSQAVYVNSDGKLGAQVSSRRFKEDIHPMEEASATLYRLKPVTFRYKKEIDRRGMQQLGLVAEEVAVVSPDLVIRDKEGKPYSVRYDQVNAMLLNEFLKEHKKIEAQSRKNEEQKTTIVQLKKDFQVTSAQQQKEIQFLSAQLREQAVQIQKVSAQIELNRPAPQQVVLKTP
jgi:hypothetical protein